MPLLRLDSKRPCSLYFHPLEIFFCDHLEKKVTVTCWGMNGRVEENWRDPAKAPRHWWSHLAGAPTKCSHRWESWEIVYIIIILTSQCWSSLLLFTLSIYCIIPHNRKSTLLNKNWCCKSKFLSLCFKKGPMCSGPAHLSSHYLLIFSLTLYPNHIPRACQDFSDCPIFVVL